MYWVTALLLGEQSWQDAVNRLDLIFYVLSLWLALIGLVVFATVIRRGAAARSTRLSRAFYAIAGVLALYHVADVSFIVFFTGSVWLYLALRIAYWVVPVCLWLRLGFPGGAGPRRWSFVRSRIVVLYAPVILTNALFIFPSLIGGLRGLATYHLGTQLLALGYMRLAGGGEPPPPPPPPRVQGDAGSGAGTGDGTAPPPDSEVKLQ
ncbi:MAG: hypothetical protein LC785_01280 [Acidobacteria bacterium]|nr:hypothetical protein [Acidobacteriota bacterium]